MKGFKRYERYKDSGVEWIREIPEHWKTTRLKYLKKSPFMYGANESAELDNPNLPRFIRITDIDFNGNLKEETFKSLPLELAEPYLLEEGDILFARSGASVGKTFIYERKWGPACFAGYLIRFQTDESKAIPKFIYYFCQTSIYEDWIKENTIQSTIQNVSAEKYSSLILPVPPLNTQNIIVNYLDQKTAEIDSLIADKEKLIELLQEQRQAIITLAVTKGLDPNVPLKDSGIEWLGEIPEHWNCIRMKYICDINPSKSELKASSNTKITFLSMENISEEGILNLQEERELAEVYNGFTYFRENDVIVAKITPCFENGKVAICKGLTNGLGFGTTELHVLRAKNIVYAEYIYLVIQSHIFRNMGTALMKGAAGQKRVPTEFIQNFTIGIPPMNEQKDIINYVKQKSDYLFALINSTKIEIDKLKEYRQSLITAAVTGKIDVRNYNIEKNQMKGEEQEEVS